MHLYRNTGFENFFPFPSIRLTPTHPIDCNTGRMKLNFFFLFYCGPVSVGQYIHHFVILKPKFVNKQNIQKV